MKKINIITAYRIFSNKKKQKQNWEKTLIKLLNDNSELSKSFEELISVSPRVLQID